MVHDQLPLALRGVERRRGRLLVVRMVRNVEEFPHGPEHAASESVDEGGAAHVILKR
jgi:hypothetical protein